MEPKKNEDEQPRLLRALKTYSTSGAYPFHMPGHKRNPAYMALPAVHTIDITEIDGFDDLHHAEGILWQAQQRAARVRGADRTWFLVNGSTGGLLAAISACTCRGSRILVARNSHKSVYHAIELCGLRPVYIYPKIHKKYGIYEGIDPDDVARLLEKYGDIKAVVITSPTYEGVISDVNKIADVVHRSGICLIVDSAHGAHLGYHEAFGPSAVSCKADLVIESLHKTLPSMTQTALLHRCGSLADDRRIQKYLSVYQTSSPSYVMMASMDECMALLECRAHEVFDAYAQRLKHLRKRLGELEHIRLLNAQTLCEVPGSLYDDSKLVLFIEKCRGMGQWLYDRLREDYGLQMEMASADYVLAMTSLCDTDEGFGRLEKALCDLDRKLKAMPAGKPAVCDGTSVFEHLCPTETPVLSSDEVSRLCVEVTKLSEAVGRLGGEYLYIYPPGVPFCVPGERITPEMLELIKTYEDAGLKVLGLTEDHRIQVLKEPEE